MQYYDDEFLLKSITLHGPTLKKVIAMEEMGELIQQLSKNLRGEGRREDLIEEMADVLLMLKTVQIAEDITDTEIQNMIDIKTKRQKMRDLAIKKGE